MRKNNNSINFRNIETHLTLTESDSDPMRHVFNADGIIYRGIHSDRAVFIESLFEKGVLDNLINAGLLTASRLERKNFNGYSLLVEQNELSSPVFSKELPPSMRRDAGLVLLRIAEILDKYGLALFNFDLSDMCINEIGYPVFHNLDAIVNKDNRKFPYAEFYANFLAPLRLVHKRPELAGIIQHAGRLNIDEDISIRWPIFRGTVRWISCFGKIGDKVEAFYKRLIISPFNALLSMGRYRAFIVAGLKERKVRKKLL